MTLKQQRRLVAANGHTGPEPVDLRPGLPDDFPNETKRNPKNRAPQYPRTADKRIVRRIVRMLESTMVVQEVDRFLRNHPGQKSRISTKALLLGMILDAYETGRYLRSATSVRSSTAWTIASESNWDCGPGEPEIPSLTP